METFSLSHLSKDQKIGLLKELGFDVKGDFVIEHGERVKDRYVGVDVSIANMLIFPGSTIILDNNPLSIASYLEEFRDKNI
ncbi:MAG: hypothetical protein V1822_04345 [Candidatus Micrarchaeota archaeon]